MKDLNMNKTASFFFTNDIPYAAIPKKYLKDKNLSLKAKGLLTILYTLPEEWEYNMKGISTLTGLSLKVIRGVIQELEILGYIQRIQKKDSKGRFIYEYYINIVPWEYMEEAYPYMYGEGDINFQEEDLPKPKEIIIDNLNRVTKTGIRRQGRRYSYNKYTKKN